MVVLLCQPQPTVHDPHDRRTRSVPALGLVRLQFRGHGSEAVGSQTERGSGIARAFLVATGQPRQHVAIRRRTGAAKQFPGPLRVPGHAIEFALTDLYGGGSEVNQPLNKPGFWSGSAEGVPEALPCLVRFPVPAAVEKVQGVQPLEVRGERGGKNAASGSRVSRNRGEDGRRPWAAVGVRMISRRR